MDYTSLITAYFKKSPRFTALVDLLTRAFDDNKTLLESIQVIFDLDTAVGQQLDYVGQWIGMSRNISPAVVSAFFSFDIENLGFDEGYWKTKYADQGMTTMTDDIYRQMLYAKVIVNQWDGKTETAVEALQIAFPSNSIFIVDHQNMTMDVAVSGKLTNVQKALFTRGYFSCRPAGVKIARYLVPSVQETPFFGFDLNTTAVAGFDIGSWMDELQPS